MGRPTFKNVDIAPSTSPAGMTPYSPPTLGVWKSTMGQVVTRHCNAPALLSLSPLPLSLWWGLLFDCSGLLCDQVGMYINTCIFVPKYSDQGPSLPCLYAHWCDQSERIHNAPATALSGCRIGRSDPCKCAEFHMGPFLVYIGTSCLSQPYVIANLLPLHLTHIDHGIAATQGVGWEGALARAKAFVSNLTLDEKVLLVSGVTGPCVGNVAPIPRLGFSGICLQDGPLAIRQATYASVFPAGLTTAASWDKSLMYTRGLYIGEEFKGKGAHVALGPVVGPLGRSAYDGRNWEGN